MAATLEQRRNYSRGRLSALQEILGEASSLVGDKAAVYVTGSYGRGEASGYSDLDLFIVGTSGTHGERLFPNLDEICLKAELIRSASEQKFPPFSGDGEYLEHYTVGNLVKSLGTPEDDATNTFTARLLLLLESKVLVGNEAYEQAIDSTIKAYWRDYEGHEESFLPAFLANDIIRLWRTFCVNYEARTSPETDEKRKKRRLKSYKLKHSRLLTCYSALLALMDTWARQRTVSPEAARQIISMTPTERVEHIRASSQPAVAAALDRMLEHYENFLEATNAPEGQLLEKMGDERARNALFASAEAFGLAVFDAVEALGSKGSFHRMLVV
jgi:hypothetical protein